MLIDAMKRQFNNAYDVLEAAIKSFTPEQWRAGAAPWFYQDGTFLFMLIFTLVVWAGALAVFALQLYREGKHLDEVGRAAAAGK